MTGPVSRLERLRALGDIEGATRMARAELHLLQRFGFRTVASCLDEALRRTRSREGDAELDPHRRQVLLRQAADALLLDEWRAGRLKLAPRADKSQSREFYWARHPRPRPAKVR